MRYILIMKLNHHPIYEISNVSVEALSKGDEFSREAVADELLEQQAV